VTDLHTAGVEVTLVHPPIDQDLDAAVSLAAYRIVQESLTNVLKHSRANLATVTVATAGDALTIEVTDPGPPRSQPDNSRVGHGLVGLEERTRLLAGSLEYGAHEVGFRVRATMPLGARR
jgi:signal transduction histidine kinase